MSHPWKNTAAYDATPEYKFVNPTRKLRRWKAADAGVLRDADNACFPNDTSFYNDERCHWWVVEDEKLRVVAYASLRVSKDGRVAKFTRCGVLPGFRGQGLQRELIRARVAWCKRNGVRTIRTYTSGPRNPDGGDNVASRENLRRSGFRSRLSKDGKWRFYWMTLA